MSKRYRTLIKRFLRNREDDIFYKRKHFPCIGSGCYGDVYRLSKSKVFKVFDDSAYRRFVEFVLNNKNYKHFPRIYDHFTYEDYEIVVMEKLAKGNDFFVYQDVAESQGYVDCDSGLWRGQFGKSFDKALEDLEYQTSEDVEWDLHGGNLMKRKNGTVVITDPWCC